MSTTEKNKNSGGFALPDWASDCELYRIQVREVTQYAMFTLDPTGTLLTWNAGVEHILGYSEKDWLGKHASMIFTPDDNTRDICQSEMNMAVREGSLLRYSLAFAQRWQYGLRARVHDRAAGF